MSDEDGIFDYTLWTHISALASAARILLTGGRVQKFWKQASELIRQAEKSLRLALAELAATLDITLPALRPSKSSPKEKIPCASRQKRSFSVLPPQARFGTYAYTYDAAPLIEVGPTAPSDITHRLSARIARIDAVTENPERHARRLALLLSRRGRVTAGLRYLSAGYDLAPETLMALTPEEPPPAIDSG